MSGAPKQIDATPDVSVVTAIAGATFELAVTLPAGFASATHTPVAEILPYRGSVPAVTAMTCSWPQPSVAAAELTSAETLLLAGEHGFAVWLELTADRTDRVCVMRGRLKFEAPA